MRKYKIPSLISCCMYLLGCHCLVALYMSTDCFKVWMRARIKSVTLKITPRLAVYKYHLNEPLPSEMLQTEKSRT